MKLWQTYDEAIVCLSNSRASCSVGSVTSRCGAAALEVKRDRPGLFNSLNLATLQLGRPAVLEAPEECADFETGEQYLNAWRAWSAAVSERECHPCEFGHHGHVSCPSRAAVSTSTR